jgi:hypothetical protein
MGSTGLNDINIEGYMNVFEIMVDDLVAENGGLDCSLAIEHDKRNQEEEKGLFTMPVSRDDRSILIKSSSNSSFSGSSLHP